MAIDLDQLRRQYSDMTDAALLEIAHEELAAEAQQCYDDELARRRLRPPSRGSAAGSGEPEWLAEGMMAMSTLGDQALDGVGVLDRAGIPCFVVHRAPEEPGAPSMSDLLVPPAQHLVAMSVLDRDLFNPQVEADWKSHFSSLNDQELLDIDADLLVAGMRDRIDRLVRAYEDELLRRGLAELET